MQKTLRVVWTSALILLPLLADANFQQAIDTRLAGQDDWDRALIEQVVASGQSNRVNLERPLRLLITYATARAIRHTVHFKPDIYQRDAALLTALNGDFQLHRRDLKTARR